MTTNHSKNNIYIYYYIRKFHAPNLLRLYYPKLQIGLASFGTSHIILLYIYTHFWTDNQKYINVLFARLF